MGLFSGAARPSTGATPTLGKTTTAYDAEYTTVTDPAGKTRRSRLDGLGRLVRVDEPTGSPGALGTTDSPNQATTYGYNALDNLTRVTQGSQTRTFAYDSLSRLTSAANPESGAIAYSYDNNGNLTQRTDARSVVTGYTYDRLDRLTRRSYSYTGSETAVSLGTTRVDYAYDSCGSYSRGRLCSVTAKKGSTTEVSRTAYNRYDALGRVLESTQTTGGTSYTMAYAYDRAGNLTSQRYPSDRVVDYVYDGAGRIAGVKTGIDDWYAGGTGSNAVDYEPHGGVKQLLLGNGLWEQRRYNVRLQPTRIGLGTTQATGSLTATGPTPTAGLLLLDYSYGTASNNGNVLSQRIRVGTSLNQNQVYTYDALNRLKTAGETGSGTAWSQTCTYDRYGNRRVTAGAAHGSNQALTPQSTADIAAATNRLAGLNGVNAVAYDAAGNLKADWSANAFKYDGDNRLVAFDAPLGTDSDTTYAYDGEGRRVRKVVGGSSGVATTYVYNVLGQLVAEFGGTAPDRPGTRYLTPDPLGSTRLVTAEDQSVLSRHDYLPFGEEIGTTYGGRSSVSGYTPSRTDGPTQKFTGKERDTESGLDYFGARYFSGAGGRFTSVDPALSVVPNDPQTWNQYAYVTNRPLNYVDPDGLWPTHIHNEFIRAAFPRLSNRQIGILQKASLDADTQYFKRHEMHHTRNASTSGKVARQNYEAYLAQRIGEAQRAQIGKGDNRVIINEAALVAAGLLLHAVMDSTSPPHLDEEGNPAFYNYDNLVSQGFHFLRELWYTEAQKRQTINKMRHSYGLTFGVDAAIAASGHFVVVLEPSEGKKETVEERVQVTLIY